MGEAYIYIVSELTAVKQLSRTIDYLEECIDDSIVHYPLSFTEICLYNPFVNIGQLDDR